MMPDEAQRPSEKEGIPFSDGLSHRLSAVGAAHDAYADLIYHK